MNLLDKDGEFGYNVDWRVQDDDVLRKLWIGLDYDPNRWFLSLAFAPFISSKIETFH